MGLLVARQRVVLGDRTNSIRDQPPAWIALDALPGCQRALLRSRALGQRRPQRLRVELVRMEVQHRVRVLGGDLPQGAAQDGGRERAPVGASAYRDRAAADGPDGDRVLPDLAALAEVEPVRGTGNASDAVADAGRVVLTGVVAEAELGQDVVGPRGLARDREGRRAVAERPLAAQP